MGTVDGEKAAYSLGDGLRVQKFSAEGFPVLIVARLLDDNLLKVVGQLEDDELVLLAELEVVPGGHALLVDGCSVRWVWLLILCPHSAEASNNVMSNCILVVHRACRSERETRFARPAAGLRQGN